MWTGALQAGPDPVLHTGLLQLPLRLHSRLKLLCQAGGVQPGEEAWPSPPPLQFCGGLQVGPADIDAVAAIGDFLAAGTAALANTTTNTFRDFPEVSFAMGGAGDWRSVTTLPNLLRQFNPALIGFSVGEVP